MSANEGRSINDRRQSYLQWLGRDSILTSALALPAAITEQRERREQHLRAGTFSGDDVFIGLFEDLESRRRATEQYRTLNALGIGIVLTLQWDGGKWRMLRSLLPDGRYGASTAMGAQLKRRVPMAQLACPVSDGFAARQDFHRDRRLHNHALFTGQLVGAPERRLTTEVGELRSVSVAHGFGIDAVLDGLSMFNEPFSITLVVEPLPAEQMVGALDFLLAMTSVCASGTDVTLTTSRSVTLSEGKSETDPRYRVHRTVVGTAQTVLSLAAAAAMLASGGAAAPLVIAAGAAGASRIDLADLFGWKAEIQVGRSASHSDQMTHRRVDEHLNFYSTKLRELTSLFDSGGQHGLWTWYGVVSAGSLSVAQGVADTFAGRLSMMGNSLEPIRTRLVSRGDDGDVIDEAIDLALIPRVQEPVGLLGQGYGSLVQSQTLPYLLAGPTASHAGIRVIRHYPVGWTRSVAGEAIELGGRPDDASVPVRMSLADMTGHLLVCGRTGSGKSVLTRRILKGLRGLDHPIPFVFIDMAQSLECRDWGFAHEPVWYEAGRQDLGTPMPSLGLLDFGSPDEYDHYVWQLADLLGNWLPSEGPLALLLTELLHEAYRPLLSEEGHYWIAGIPEAPSIASLEGHIDTILSREGGRYEGELRGNLRGALTTRLRRVQSESLREMLEGPSSEWFQTLSAKRDVIVSFARSGSTSERCFLALVMLIKIRQWLRDTRKETEPGRPRLVVALDEAHILLRKTAERDRASQSNIHAYAVRWFDELMAEIRQLGAAIIVVDQSPSLLADSVLFSTNNKVVFALGSGADTEAVAAALPIPREQADLLGSLPNLMAYVRAANERDLALVVVDPPGKEAK